MSPGRAECPVLTCTRDMPVGQVMCVQCWAKVPTALRKAIGTNRTAHRRQLVLQALSAAQAAP